MSIAGAPLKEFADDIRLSVMFLTRLPLPRTATDEASGMASATAAYPIAGLVVGLIGAMAYWLPHRVGLPPWLAASLAVAATLAVTGCLHEDGLADTADGFGGGATRERKLDIMRDSRIGSYGVCALTLSLLLRVGALAALADPSFVAWALIAAHSAARATMTAFMFALPPARSDGLSFTVGAPPQRSVLIASALGIAILAVCLGPALASVSLLVLIIIMGLMAWLSFAQIGGQSGDVIGALEQVSEIAILLCAVA